jgi:hypothetical protein
MGTPIRRGETLTRDDFLERGSRLRIFRFITEATSVSAAG